MVRYTLRVLDDHRRAMTQQAYSVQPIGHIHSTPGALDEAPRQGTAPGAAGGGQSMLRSIGP
jgi:hypothetical protein